MLSHLASNSAVAVKPWFGPSSETLNNKGQSCCGILPRAGRFMMELDTSDDEARSNWACISSKSLQSRSTMKLPMLLCPLANRLIHRVSKPQSRSLIAFLLWGPESPVRTSVPWGTCMLEIAQHTTNLKLLMLRLPSAVSRHIAEAKGVCVWAGTSNLGASLEGGVSLYVLFTRGYFPLRQAPPACSSHLFK